MPENQLGTAISPVPTDCKRKFEDLQPESTKEQPLESNTDGGETNAAVTDEGENKRPRLDHKGKEKVHIQFSIEKLGSIIGREGATIDRLRTESRAHIEVKHDQYNVDYTKGTLEIIGDKKQIQDAKFLINEVVNEPTLPVMPPPFRLPDEAWRHYVPPVGSQRDPHFGRSGVPLQQGQLGSHFGHRTTYGYQQRGSYPYHNQPYAPPQYGNYPQHMAPRSSSFCQQSSHNSFQGPGYHNKPYAPPQYGNYPQHMTPRNSFLWQRSSHPSSQGPPSQQGGQQYGRPPVHSMPPSQRQHPQSYGHPRATQPGSAPAQSSRTNMLVQQPSPYAFSGPSQPAYPTYGSTYRAVYAQPGGQPSYAQPGGQP